MIPEFLIRPLMYAAIALALLVAGFAAGGLYVSGKWKDAEAKRATEAVKIVTRQGAATERVITKYRDRIKEVEGETKVVEKLVYRFVPSGADPVLPRGWRVLHDAAAVGAVPEAPAGADVAAPDVKASAAATGVIGNYGLCRVTAARLEELQEWVTVQYETTNLQPLRW